MKKKNPQLIIRHHSPWRRGVGVAVIAVLFAASGWWMFDYGRARSGVDYRAAMAERDQMRETVSQLQRKLSQLREQAARMASLRRIDEHATASVRANLNRLQQDNQDLREELQFYRNIVSPEDRKPGLRVQSLRIDPGVQPRSYHYSFTLIHIREMKSRRELVTGHVNMSVEGLQGTVPKVLDVAKLNPGHGSDLSYSVKYFKQFDGDLVLPEGFIPQNVVIRVVPSSKKSDDVEKRFDWPVAAG